MLRPLRTKPRLKLGHFRTDPQKAIIDDALSLRLQDRGSIPELEGSGCSQNNARRSKMNQGLLFVCGIGKLISDHGFDLCFGAIQLVGFPNDAT